MPVAHVDAAGQKPRAEIFFRRFRHHDDAAHIFRQQLTRNHRHGKPALDRLAAGHRHRVVIENLVGNRIFGRHRLPDRQQAGMLIGAIAEIGENMFCDGEGRLPGPSGAFAAHLGKSLRRLGIEPGRHVMTADARQRAAAFRQAHGGPVMRTARTIMRHARRHRLQRLGFALIGVEQRQLLRQ